MRIKPKEQPRRECAWPNLGNSIKRERGLAPNHHSALVRLCVKSGATFIKPRKSEWIDWIAHPPLQLLGAPSSAKLGLSPDPVPVDACWASQTNPGIKTRDMLETKLAKKPLVTVCIRHTVNG